MTEAPYGTTAAGAAARCWTLASPDLEVVVTDYGATVLSCRYRGRELTLQYASLAEIEANPGPYYGATVGRVANRLANGAFEIDGTRYADVPKNAGAHSLHGGAVGFDKRVWAAEAVGAAAVKFTLRSEDGDQGYPGTLDAEITYTVADAVLRIDIGAAALDKPTPVNIVNHTYWNFEADGDAATAAHRLSRHALHVYGDRYLPTGEGQVPTGETASAVGFGPFVRCAEGGGIEASSLSEAALATCDGGGKPGVDHCFLVDRPADEDSDAGPPALAQVARLSAQGVAMDLYSTQPAVQVYTGNFLATDAAAAPHVQHNAICLETQHLPNAVNTPGFDRFGGSTVLRKGASWRHVVEHRFGEG